VQLFTVGIFFGEPSPRLVSKYLDLASIDIFDWLLLLLINLILDIYGIGGEEKSRRFVCREYH
jgi:hypothetical protein